MSDKVIITIGILEQIVNDPKENNQILNLYKDTIPQNFDHLPILFSDAELKLLEGSNLLSKDLI